MAQVMTWTRPRAAARWRPIAPAAPAHMHGRI